MDLKLILIIVLVPVLSAFIGWLTNYIAIKSLFKPYNEISVFGLKFQGIIPKRKEDIAEKLSKVIVDYLISNDDLLLNFDDFEKAKRVKDKLVPILSSKILDNIPAMMKPMAEPLIAKVLEKEGINLVRELGVKMNDHFFENIDIKKIVYDKLIEADFSKFEEILNKIAKSELKHIEYLGAIIGGLVGIFQVLIFIFLN